MNKKLLIAAVGAALVAGPMVAAHAGATLYGHFHMSMDRYDNGGDPSQEEGMMANNSSRFGIKGDEDLGGGLKAIYQVESGTFAADEGTSGFGGTLRNTYVGFAGSSWGSVKFGRHDTLYKELGRKLDNFNEQVGDARNVIGNGSGWDNRISNMIRYDSPSFAGGWQAGVQHTSNDGSDTSGNTVHKDNSIGVNWTSGPIFLGFAWNEQGTSTTNDESGKRFAGSYTFNDIVLGLFWESMSDVGGTSGHDRDAMGLFASTKMGNNKFKFHWLDADKFDDSTTADGGTLWAIGVDHSFSKTVVVYANYASVDNDTAAAFNTASSNGGHGDNLSAATGKSPTAYTLGTIIKF